MKKIRILIFIFFFQICHLYSTTLFAQIEGHYNVEMNGTFSHGKYTPFWQHANRFGLTSLQPNNGYLRESVFITTNTKKRWSYSGGLDMAEAYNFSSVFYLQQLYAQVRYRKATLMIGSREIEPMLKNRALSSGALTFSGNARPIPQIRLSLPEYTRIFSNFYIMGHISYGMFTDGNFQKKECTDAGQYTENPLYHSKAGFLKWESKENPMVYEVGLEMATQFGGKVHIRDKDGNITTQQMPQKLSDFLKAFIPRKGAKDGPPIDRLNIAGNQLGSWHASITYKGNGWKIRPYYEHYFEDHSMMFFDFLWIDGLYGVELTLPRNRIASTIVCEFTSTKDQSGPVYWDHTTDLDMQVSGHDDYYNHGSYVSWTNYGMSIGTPLVISPLYNDTKNFAFTNNRYNAYHIGITGDPTHELSYRLLATLSHNWGTYNIPYAEIKRNFSLLTEISYQPSKLSGWEFKASFALDRGDLLGNNTGAGISICKRGLFTSKRK